MTDLQAPFPYIGGKSRIASRVWGYLGDVPNYVEPFAGSLAVLLSRPTEPKIETVNDLDGFVCNFWRALKAEPKLVAEHATNPVNENDLHARHSYLVSVKEDIEPRLSGDPDFYDAKLAGWWAWGVSCWLGGEFCAGNGPWRSVDGRLVKGDARQGVTKRLPQLGIAGQGVTKQLPHLGNPFAPSDELLGWFYALAARLRTVRICCGDWSRVCDSRATLTGHGTTGVFIDPPYGHDLRAAGLYANDDVDVTADVEAWCRKWGDNPQMRIVLCGYEGEYDLPGWRVDSWKASGGYGRLGNGRGKENRHKERLWISPHCLTPGLF